MAGTVTRVVTGADSAGPVISGNGAKVAFETYGALLPEDTNGTLDVYVADLATGALTLVSTGAYGPGNGYSSNASISADGSKVAFASYASNLVAGDATPYAYDIYVRDLGTGALTLVSTGAYGQANRDSLQPVISADGAKVAFMSLATNLAAGDGNGSGYDVFLKDLTSGAVTLVSAGLGGGGNSDSYDPSISADGSKVAFDSAASNLLPDVSNGVREVFLKDIASGALTLVSTGAHGQANAMAYAPSISADGTKVAFQSTATNLLPDYLPYGDLRVFLKDLVTGAVTLVGDGYAYAPSISADGAKVAFQTYGALLPEDTNGRLDVYVRDLATGALTLASAGASELQNGPNDRPSLSADGSKVAYQGYGAPPGKQYGETDIFVTSYAPPNRAPTALALSGGLVAEHVAAGTPVGTLSATDPDAGDTATFSLVQGAGDADDAAFAISGNQLRILVSPDYNAQSSYAIRVRVMDSGGLSYEQAFTVGVIDVNDAPTIAGNGTATLPDNGTAKPFAAVVVSDPDVGQTLTATVSYAAANGVLLDLDAAGNGSSSGAGAYAVSGSAAQVQAALRGLVFVPTANQVAVGQSVATTFALGVTDGSLAATDSSAMLVAASANDAPLALPRAGTVDEDGGPLLLPPGWADPDLGDSHRFALSLAGTLGAASIDPVTGAITYSPNGAFEWLSAGQTATDTFAYAVTDGSGAGATAGVTVTVVGANDAPTVVAAATTAAGATSELANATASGTLDTLSGSVAFTDVDLLDSHTVRGSLTGVAWSGPGAAGGGVVPGAVRDALAQALGVTLVADSTRGATGTAGWSFGLPDGTLDFLAQGDTLTATYAITVADAYGGTVVQPVTVTVTGTNDAAVIGGTTTGAVKEDAALSASGQLTVADPDAGQSVFQAPASLVGSYGTFAFDSLSGRWSYALANGSAAVQGLAAGQTVTDTLVVKSLDGTASQAVMVSVAGTNDAPTIDPAATKATGAVAVSLSPNAGALTSAGTVGFADPDLADAHSVAAAFAGSTYAGGQLGALRATVAKDTTGTGAGGRVGWTYAVDNARVQFLSAGQQVTETYNVAVSDGQGGSATQAVAVTVTGTNHPPAIAGAVAGQAVGDNATVKPFGKVQVTDPDGGAKVGLAITVTGGDANGVLSGAGLTKTGAGSYQLAAAAPGALTAALDALVFTPTANQVAVGKTVATGFTLKATDDQGATATDATASVVVTSVNDAPTLAKATLSYTVAEGQTVQNLYRDILANVRDADPGDAAQVTITGVGASGSGAAFLDPARKTLTYTAGGFDAKQPTDRFTYTVSDGHGGTATGTVALTVTGANLPTQVGTAGADTLVASAANTRLIGVGGNDLLVSGAAGTLVYAGDGDDTVAVGAAKAVVHGGAGTNTLLFGAAQDTAVLQQGSRDEIYGFNLNNGSQLDLSQVLAEAQLSLSGTNQLGAYFGVTASGADAALLFNPNGVAAGAGSVLAVLHGVGAGTTLAALVGHDAIRI